MSEIKISKTRNWAELWIKELHIWNSLFEVNVRFYEYYYYGNGNKNIFKINEISFLTHSLILCRKSQKNYENRGAFVCKHISIHTKSQNICFLYTHWTSRMLFSVDSNILISKEIRIYNLFIIPNYTSFDFITIKKPTYTKHIFTYVHARKYIIHT